MAQKPPTTYRFDAQTIGFIDGLASVLDINKTDVVKRSVAAYRNVLDKAFDEAMLTISELRKRYGDEAMLTVFLHEKDGQPFASLRINADIPDDVVVKPIFGPAGDRASILIHIGSEADLVFRLAVGQLTGVVFGLGVGQISWPPGRGEGIVLHIGDLVPQLPADTPDKLALVEA